MKKHLLIFMSLMGCMLLACLSKGQKTEDFYSIPESWIPEIKEIMAKDFFAQSRDVFTLCRLSGSEFDLDSNLSASAPFRAYRLFISNETKFSCAKGLRSLSIDTLPGWGFLILSKNSPVGAGLYWKKKGVWVSSVTFPLGSGGRIKENADLLRNHRFAVLDHIICGEFISIEGVEPKCNLTVFRMPKDSLLIPKATEQTISWVTNKF